MRDNCETISYDYRTLTDLENENLLLLLLQNKIDVILKQYPWLDKTNNLAEILINHIKKQELHTMVKNANGNLEESKAENKSIKQKIYTIVMSLANKEFFFNKDSKNFFIHFLPLNSAVEYCKLIKLTAYDVHLERITSFYIKSEKVLPFWDRKEDINKRLASILLELDLSDKSWEDFLWSLAVIIHNRDNRECNANFKIFQKLIIKLSKANQKITDIDYILNEYYTHRYYTYDVWKFLSEHNIFHDNCILHVALIYQKRYNEKISLKDVIELAQNNNWKVTKEAWKEVKSEAVEPLAKLAKQQSQVLFLSNTEQLSLDIYNLIKKNRR